ncbi:MAG: hypothetical protein KKE86_00630 [Planctomycetes bacterium]|nr:hypothetical protein [Planctomycetota bacterium]MBU4397815.1 hypothetical protein [Planctomycetota bacterium]MCG2683792.1 hypothetical protein [Planctomycetales bacterium]
MKNHEAISTLNQLLGVLCRSLPAYLSDARPWSRLGSWKTQTSIDRLVADLRMYARRVAEEIDSLGGCPDSCVFPAEFTAKNDLAVQFLLGEIIDYLDRDAASIERIAARLENIPAAHALAEEILGNVKGHVDVLKKIVNDE